MFNLEETNNIAKRHNEEANASSAKRTRTKDVIIIDDDDDVQFVGQKKLRARKKWSRRRANGAGKSKSNVQDGEEFQWALPIPMIRRKTRMTDSQPYESDDPLLYRHRDTEVVEWLNKNDGSKLINPYSSKTSQMSVLAYKADDQFVDVRPDLECRTAPSLESVVSKFGSNLYNPNAVLRKGLRTIVIDGSNVAMG